MSKIVAITNQKGGVGKTTTTINLASCLGELEKKVLIVDVDSQGNATQGLGVDKIELEKMKKTSHDFMLADEDDVHNFISETRFKNVDIIGASQHLSGFDMEYSGNMQKELILKKRLKQLKTEYDFILIDCPPSLSSITINGLVAADGVIIPVQSEFYALEGMTQLLNTIKLCKKHLNKRLRIEGILMTMYSTNTKLSESVYEEVKYYFTKYVYKTVIRRNIALAEAPSYGEPINYYDKSSKGAQDYMSFAREVIENGN
ncbi:MAG: ParA family protein [Mycoplasmatales bacterium]